MRSQVDAGSLVLPSVFRGPAASANGGYAAGAVAQLVDGPAGVRLRRPPPVDVPLRVERSGESVTVLEDDDVVLVARRREPLTQHLPPIDLGVAARARAASDVLAGHPAPTCFVCGPQRSDGLRIFPGAVADGVVATTWTPPAALSDSAGDISPPVVWAVLDCPGGWALPADEELGPYFPALIEQHVDIPGPIRAGEQLVVLGWHTGREGRRLFANAALVAPDGGIRAFAEQVCYAMAADWGRHIPFDRGPSGRTNEPMTRNPNRR